MQADDNKTKVKKYQPTVRSCCQLCKLIGAARQISQLENRTLLFSKEKSIRSPIKSMQSL
jgi:hypothetical protein